MVKKEKSFKEVLAEIESPQDIGKGSWALPKNATPAEKAKYELCQGILAYKQDNNLSDEIIARKVHTTQKELEDFLHCRISKFTLDNLINVASKLLSSSKIEIIIGQKTRKNFHVPVV